jgi:cystathionine beta-lyase
MLEVMTLQIPPLSRLRERTSSKWRTYPDDVLPLFVAELDVELAEPIREALEKAVRDGDTGYAGPDRSMAEAFADFCRWRWGWPVNPAQVISTTDVSVVIVESLRMLTTPGDGVIVTPPIYPPFFDLPPEAGARTVSVPLLDDNGTWRLDLDGIETQMAAGAKVVLLCNPHNPLGVVFPEEDLLMLSQIVARHDGFVISDEVHAPMTHPDATFTPYLCVSDEAREHGVAAHSASKPWNVAGLKCAQFVTASDRMQRILAGMADEVRFRTGIFGRIASRAAYASARDWLDELVRFLHGNRVLLTRLLAERLPEAGYREPRASYLAWLDLTRLGWGENPGRAALSRARVALNNGPTFGSQGAGHVRLNFGCSAETLTEAIDRLAAARN